MQITDNKSFLKKYECFAKYREAFASSIDLIDWKSNVKKYFFVEERNL